MLKKNAALVLCDLVFVCCAALYSLLALEGVIAISGGGVAVDSDLATYAQALAHAAHPESFAADPVLRADSPAVDIHNLQSLLARPLMGGDGAAAGLLRAGAVAIFVFCCGWYALGRWLFTRPPLAALLAVMCGITVWIEFGTFWGVNHSDPVPRVFFAAVYPLLLLVALQASRRLALRPLTMFLAGAAMWVHGVSALNCGAMFMALFITARPRGASAGAQLRSLALSLCAFLLPVAVFLWPSFSDAHALSAQDLATFREIFAIRWNSDYSDSPRRLLHLMTSVNAWSMLALGGFCAWLLTLYAGNAHEKILAKACPAFIAAMFAVALFSFGESGLSHRLGRLPMGHELVRGVRFLVPLSVTMIVISAHILVPRPLVWPGVCIAVGLAFAFSADRQYGAAQYALGERAGLELPLSEPARRMREAAQGRRAFMDEIKKIVPPGEAVFCEDEDLAVRHYALRPLAHSFKDGYIYYYNRDGAGAREWLRLEALLREKPGGLIRAWLACGAPWLVMRDGPEREEAEKYGEIIAGIDGFLILKRKGEAPPSSPPRPRAFRPGA